MTMKKIKFTQVYSTARQVFLYGKEYDLPESEAGTLIRCGIAAPAEEKTGNEKPAVKSTKKGKRNEVDANAANS